MPVAAIHLAARKIDVAAIQRELDAGVAPDLIDTGWTSSAPLRTAINYGSAIFPAESIHRRLACIEVLLDAGASLDTLSGPGDGETALHAAVSLTDRSNYPANFELIVDRLMLAGADVNALDGSGTSVLARAALKATSTTVAKLLSAGAVDPGGFDKPVRCARFRPRICAILMRAGGVLKLDPDPYGRLLEPPYGNMWLEQSPYLRKIVEYPGGFKAYELAHRRRITAIFLPKLPSLPAEIVSHIVSFGFNCGCY